MSDETKDYHLSDLEDDKLITLYDVRFFKDNLPSSLAIINVKVEYSGKKNVNVVVYKAIEDIVDQDITTDITSSYNSKALVYQML